jgi:hypothetical protein
LGWAGSKWRCRVEMEAGRRGRGEEQREEGADGEGLRVIAQAVSGFLKPVGAR